MGLLSVDMDAELEGAEKLDESEIGEMLGDVEVHAELVFLLSSMLIFKIEDKAEMVFIEEVDFGFEVDGCLSGVEFF